MTEASTLNDEGSNGSPDISATVTFIHLSDIHFRSTTLDDPFDLDADLRLQLEADLARVRELAGPVTGFLISGDIAFSGDPMQYDNVTHWFNRLSEIAGCSNDSIWVVPGNHDVDRRVIEQSPQTIGSYHKLLRDCDLDAIDLNLEKLLRQDVTAKEVLLKPLGPYEEFAERYGCGFQDGRPYWHYELPSTAPYAFAIRGVNSVLISDESDSSSVDTSKLVIGRMQCQIPKDDCCLVISMCHHPLTWLRDAEAVSHLLDNRAVVQLSGHDHIFQVEERESGLSIKAGAVHPVRRGSWQSRYRDLYEVAFARARERHRLGRLWDEVEHRHGVAQPRNPFREEGTE